jgi:hypothetical protein
MLINEVFKVAEECIRKTGVHISTPVLKRDFVPDYRLYAASHTVWTAARI